MRLVAHHAVALALLASACSAANSSGTGGAATTSSSSSPPGTGGTGGTGGGGCTAASDCPGQDSDCVVRTCENATCGTKNVAAGTAIASQTAHDCQVAQCDGNGVVEVVADDTDLPDDGNPCTDDTCSGGVPVYSSTVAGTPCGTDLICDGNDACVGCIDPAECPGTDDDCQARTCDNGTCGVSFTPAGTPTTSQTDHDCRKNQCDGAGNTVSVADDADLPLDNNTCTNDVCTNGVASNPPVTQGTACAQGGGKVCSAGMCVQCVTPANCPGVDTECQTRTCTAGSCGTAFAAAGKVTTTQAPGDCHRNQCDGSGAIVNVIDNGDVPGDSNSCTNDLCTAGVPSHTNVASGTACGSGSSKCDGAGTCAGCLTAADCPGADTECQTRTCTSGTCGFSYPPAGTAVASQLAGDCHKNQCDGSGNIVNAVDNTDVPADDGKQCTAETCVNGNPAHPPQPTSFACNQTGGSHCDGAGNCVQCQVDTDCGANTDCTKHACVSGACTTSFTAAGTATSSQLPGDCHQNQCDGSGNIVNVVDNGDLPVDGKQCTSDVCMGGVPSNPGVAAGTACTEGGGTQCNGSGTCWTCGDGLKNGDETGVDCGGSCPACAITVLSTTPADAATGVAVASTVAVTFSAAMDPATLTTNALPGACTGSVQVSTDDFATCIGLGTPVMSAGNTVLTLTAAPGLSYGSTYKVKVTTAALGASAQPVIAYMSGMGFTTVTPTGPITPTCNGSVVISQLYGGGGNSGATYTNDFIELHNRGSLPVDLTGWSVQYAGPSGAFGGATGTSLTQLTGTIQPGGYYLIQEAQGAGGTVSLPSPDVIGGITLGGTAGKVALVSNSTPLAAVTCPTGGAIVDFVGFGTTANCFEGAAPTPATSNTNSVSRAGAGCTDTNTNSTDFTAGLPNPRNKSTVPLVCSCADHTLNDGGDVLEADFCRLDSPKSISVAAGASSGPIKGRLYEATITTPGGASGWIAQVGYGPATVNPENQSGWSWFSATYDSQIGNDDVYQGSFTAPAAGTYRYTARFSSDGINWTYCDLNGAGSDPNLSFEVTQLPTLTVTP